MKYDADTISDWFHQLDEAIEAGKLTEWERNFVDSVAEQFDARGHLSDRQIEVLERIYAERTS